MKELQDYSNSELYGLLNHIDPYKYPERIQAIEEEIQSRKAKGEIPEQLVPDVDWSVFKSST